MPSAIADEIEEIVVTAQKREESLQETPVSVTAFTAGALAEIGAVDMDDLAQSTPGLHSHANAGGNTGAVFGIRGITRGDPESMLQPRTSLYVDGVYVAKSAGALFDIVDLERVEVLRGPQGALYGRNTTGGAINLITKRPTADKEFRTKLYGGNEEDFRLATMFNTPLLGSADALLGQGNIGTVNARVSMSYQSRDGHIENSGAGSEDFDMRDRFAGRAAFQWEASDDLTIDYTYENHTIREEPTAFHVGSLRSSGNSWALLADLSSGGNGGGSVVAAANYLNPTRQDSIHNSQVMLSDGTTMVDLVNNMDINAHSVVATQELGDATFKAITAIREVKNTDAQDLDGMPAHMAEFKLDLEVDTVSEELQLTGNTMDGRLDYVLGAFYYSEEGTADNSQVVLFVSRNDQGNDWLLESYAAYGHASYVPEFDDRFTFGAG
ncbi:MAG: TonB-dependent receptor plug domain-containing protein, partial [Deltaproteobacteria bacterium]